MCVCVCVCSIKGQKPSRRTSRLADAMLSEVRSKDAAALFQESFALFDADLEVRLDSERDEWALCYQPVCITQIHYIYIITYRICICLMHMFACVCCDNERLLIYVCARVCVLQRSIMVSVLDVTVVLALIIVGAAIMHSVRQHFN